MKRSFLGLVFVALTVALIGCGEEDYSQGPEAWRKTPDSEKLERIKHMPLSVDQKISGIQKLNVPEADKQKAIEEVKSGGNPAPQTPPKGTG